MKAFEYAAPRTEAEVVQLLSSEPGKSEILAGGTDLVGLMKQMVVTPDRVINIMDVESMKQIEVLSDGSLSIGAAVTLDDLLASSHLTDYRAVTDAILGISSIQLQSQGTLGGEICQRPQCWYFRSGQGLLSNDDQHGDSRFQAILGNRGRARFVSSSRIAPALIALSAHARVLGPGPDEEQYLPLESIYRIPRRAGERETALAPNQLLTHVLVPPAAGQSATYEVRQGEGPDFPLAAAAATLKFSGGVVNTARVVLGQVAPIPWISNEAARQLIGRGITPEVAEEAGTAAVYTALTLPDNEYKVQLAKVAVKRAILLAAGFDTGGF
jgi:xanthine dehydrogenase YagS FAD-binding subunit